MTSDLVLVSFLYICINILLLRIMLKGYKFLEYVAVVIGIIYIISIFCLIYSFYLERSMC